MIEFIASTSSLLNVTGESVSWKIIETNLWTLSSKKGYNNASISAKGIASYGWHALIRIKARAR